jgi:hypothetical protein
MLQKLNSTWTSLNERFLLGTLWTKAEAQPVIRAPGKLNQAAARRRNGKFTDMLLFNSGKVTFNREVSTATMNSETN